MKSIYDNYLVIFLVEGGFMKSKDFKIAQGFKCNKVTISEKEYIATI